MDVKIFCKQGVCIEPKWIHFGKEKRTDIPIILIQCDYEKCPARAKYKCTPVEDGRIVIYSR